MSRDHAYKAKEDRLKLYEWLGVNNLLPRHRIELSKSLIDKKKIKMWTKILQLKIGGQNYDFIKIRDQNYI